MLTAAPLYAWPALLQVAVQLLFKLAGMLLSLVTRKMLKQHLRELEPGATQHTRPQCWALRACSA
jgi:hypothetical protein